MHIPEGVLNPTAIMAGYLVTAIGTGLGLSRLREVQIPRTAMLSSAFFVASLIHIPNPWFPMYSVHLLLNGLCGIMLGWRAFPAILVGLLMQSVFFQFGGLSSLGANTCIMALPAVSAYYLFGRWALSTTRAISWGSAFLAGIFTILMSCCLCVIFLASSGLEFTSLALGILAGHLPVMAAEGIITASAVVFLSKVSPGVLYSPAVETSL